VVLLMFTSSTLQFTQYPYTTLFLSSPLSSRHEPVKGTLSQLPYFPNLDSLTLGLSLCVLRCASLTAAACGLYLEGHPHRPQRVRSEEYTSELQSRGHLVCRILLE